MCVRLLFCLFAYSELNAYVCVCAGLVVCVQTHYTVWLYAYFSIAIATVALCVFAAVFILFGHEHVCMNTHLP